MTHDDLIAHGMRLGFAFAAGMCGQAEGFDGVQLGKMLEAASENDELISWMTSEVITDLANGTSSPERFVELARGLMARTVPQ